MNDTSIHVVGERLAVGKQLATGYRQPMGRHVFMYTSVFDRIVTIVRVGIMNIMGRTTLTGSNFFIFCLAGNKNDSLSLLCFLFGSLKDIKEIEIILTCAK